MAEEDSAPAPRRRGRPAGSATGTRSASTTRGRRIGGAELVETLNEMVSQLIKENRSLKRQLAKLAVGGTNAANGTADRTLRALQRKVQRAVSAAPATRRRRGPSTPATPRPRTTRRRSADGGSGSQ
jgi:hypothetical protein